MTKGEEQPKGVIHVGGYHSPLWHGYLGGGGVYHGDGGGYPVQGYPTQHGHGHGGGYGNGNGYYGYGAPPQHIRSAPAVHQEYHRYREHGRQGVDYGHYGGGCCGHSGYVGHRQGGGFGRNSGYYGHHGKFKQGYHGKYSHY